MLQARTCPRADATAAAEQHAARVHAHAHTQASVAVCGLNLGAEHAPAFQPLQTATHDTFGVVFGGCFPAEGGQDAITGVRVHATAVGVDFEEQDADLLEGPAGHY